MAMRILLQMQCCVVTIKVPIDGGKQDYVQTHRRILRRVYFFKHVRGLWVDLEGTIYNQKLGLFGFHFVLSIFVLRIPCMSGKEENSPQSITFLGTLFFYKVSHFHVSLIIINFSQTTLCIPILHVWLST